MNIDKLIRSDYLRCCTLRFGSLMNIDKLIPSLFISITVLCFGSLMNIDKLIPKVKMFRLNLVLVL